jgi:hypothetical protein
MMEIGTIIAQLAAKAPVLACELLPGGHREGAEWVCPSHASPFGCSVSVHLNRARAGVWAAWAAGEAGDALDLVASVRFAGDKREALRWSRQWLGCDTEISPAAKRQLRLPPLPMRHDAGEAVRSRAAARLYFEGQPALAGTLAEGYLLGRAIELSALGRQPRALRFHPALSNSESRHAWPALLAGISSPDGSIFAVHRKWLAERPDGSVGKAPLANPKMTIGPFRGGCIRLWRGVSGKPLKDALPSETVLIGEGLEAALTAACVAPEYRTLCAISLSNLGAIVLPPAISTVIILAQNDPPDSAAAKTLTRAIDVLATKVAASRSRARRHLTKTSTTCNGRKRESEDDRRGAGASDRRWGGRSTPIRS